MSPAAGFGQELRMLQRDELLLCRANEVRTILDDKGRIAFSLKVRLVSISNTGVGPSRHLKSTLMTFIDGKRQRAGSPASDHAAPNNTWKILEVKQDGQCVLELRSSPVLTGLRLSLGNMPPTDGCTGLYSGEMVSSGRHGPIVSQMQCRVDPDWRASHQRCLSPLICVNE